MFLLFHFISKYDKILKLGDFNMSLSLIVIDTLELFNLTQTISEPTPSIMHGGLSLDNFETDDICVSDHKAAILNTVLSQLPINYSTSVCYNVFNSTSAGFQSFSLLLLLLRLIHILTQKNRCLFVIVLIRLSWTGLVSCNKQKKSNNMAVLH